MQDMIIDPNFQTDTLAVALVRSPKEWRTFEFSIRKHEDETTLALSPETFYCHGKGLRFPHYEIRIEDPDKGELESAPTHAFKATDESMFICWPHHTPDLDAAHKIIEGWVGAAFLAFTDRIDANLTVTKYSGADAHKTFLAGIQDGVKRDHGIELRVTMIS